MDQVSQRCLRILTELSERHEGVTQRGLAETLGIALGLTNLYLKRLARKGYVKITTIPPARVRYLVTPKGFREKSRLTYEYISYSLQLYRQTRASLREGIRPLVATGCRFAIYGTGEAAELAYLTLREFGLEPIAIYGDGPGGKFLTFPIRPVTDLQAMEADRVIMASFEPPASQRDRLVSLGVPLEKQIFLDPSAMPAPSAPRSDRTHGGRGSAVAGPRGLLTSGSAGR